MTPEITASGYLPPKKVSPWRNIGAAIFYLLIYWAVQIMVSLGYQFYLLMTMPEGLSYEQELEMLNTALYRDGNLLMLLIDALLILIIVLWFLLRKRPLLQSMGLKRTRLSSVALAVVAGIGLSCVLNVVMMIVSILFPGLMGDYNETMELTYNMQDFLLYALAGVVGAPLIEELFFRHLTTGRLARSMPRWVAILLMAVVFGIVHEHPVQWVYAGLLGIVMACIYFAYDSIWVSIAFHAGFNSLSLLSYIDTESMSATAQTLFGLGFLLFEMAFAAGGAVALIFLLLRRTHPIFRKPKAEPVLLYTEAIPGVASSGEGYFTEANAVPSASPDDSASASAGEDSQ